VSFSAGGKLVLVTSKDMATIWDPRSGRTLSRHRHVGVVGGALSPDGRFAATISFSTPWKLWATKDGRRIARLSEGGEQTSGLESSRIKFSPDGRVLIGTFGLSPAQVWNGRTGRHLYELRHAIGYEAEVVFSGDSRWLARG
jgi:WD40 repeat protein